MVQYIPGPEQILAPAAAQITEGVLNFLNPHRQFQMAVQESIARNPEIAQHFANLEAASPGLLKNLGIGRLASIPATPERQFEIANREQILGGMEAKLGAETAASKFNAQNIQQALQLIQQDPSIGMDAALKLATGQTMAERSVSGLAGDVAEAGRAQLGVPGIYAAAGTRAATGARPGELAKEQLLSQAIGKAQEMMQIGPQTTMQKLLRNEYNNEELMAIFSTPLGDAVKTQMDFYMDQLRIGLMAGRQDDAMERLMETQAFALFNAIKDPTLSVQDIMNFRRGIAPPEIAAKVQAGITRLQAGDVNDVVSRNRRDLVSLYARFLESNKTLKGEKGDESRRLLVQEIDQILDVNSKMPGGRRYTAAYESVPRGSYLGANPPENRGILPRFDVKEIVFRGPDGKVVQPGEALGAGASLAPKSEQSGGPGGGATLTPDQVKRAQDYFKSLPDSSKAAQKARWQTELDSTSFKAIFP